MLSLPALRAEWRACQRTADRLSGRTIDARIRADHYHQLYLESAENFMFPLIATHGSLWGVSHTQGLERMLAVARPLAPRRIDQWMDALDRVRDINRRVFVEVHSTFHFTRTHGRHPEAGAFVKPAVLGLYNRVHEAVRTSRPLTQLERRDLYYQVFVHEQDDIVHPGILEAMDSAGSPALVTLFKRVRPRFQYFPPGESLVFTDFTSVDQRNREGLRALDFAEAVGPERVRAAMDEYAIRPG
ncbi:MAG: hypothetical protein ACI8PZ_005094 [Myxococcota bacterium]